MNKNKDKAERVNHARAGKKLLLAIDCSFSGHSLALLESDRLLTHEHHPRILPTAGMASSLRRALRRTGSSLDDVGIVACGAGPGLFSGIRSACAWAQGIAYTRNLRLVPVPTMHAIAENIAENHRADRIIVAYPAFRGHIYLGALMRKLRGRDWTEHVAPALYDLASLPSLEGNWLLCGKKNIRICELLRRKVDGNLEKAPMLRGSLAPAIGKLALADPSGSVAALHAKPQYVREKVAWTSDEVRVLNKSPER